MRADRGRLAFFGVGLLAASACGRGGDPPDAAAGADRPAMAAGDGSAAADGSAEGEGGPTGIDGPATDASEVDATVADGSAPPDLPQSPPPPPPSPEITCEPGLIRFPATAELAVFNRPLNRLAVASNAHRVLWIIDPDACRSRVVVLPKAPLGLALHADGKRIVVGVDGGVGFVDLTAGTIEPLVFVPAAADNVLADDRGFVHAFPGGRSPQMTRVVSTSLETGQSQNAVAVPADAVFVPHPVGRFAYLVPRGDYDIRRVDVSTGIAIAAPGFSLPVTPFKHCGQLAVSEDGRRGYSGCGEILRLAPRQEGDLTPEGRLDGVTEAAHLDAAVGKVALLVSFRSLYTPAQPPVRVHDGVSGQLIRTFDLPALEAAPERTRGQKIFLRADGARAYVLLGSGPGYSDVTQHGVAVLGDDVPAAPPPPARDGGAPPAAVANRSAPLGTPALETGLGRERPLPWRATAAIGTGGRGLIVAGTAAPKPAVQILDPESGLDRAIPMPAEVTGLSLRDEDGLLAVAHQAGIALVSLSDATVTRSVAVPGVARVLFVPGGRLWVVSGPRASRLLQVLDPATGQLAPLPGYLQSLEGLTAHPDGRRAYAIGAAIVRADVTDRLTTAAQLDAEAHGTCVELWLSPRDELYTGCARVVRLAAEAQQDLTYAGGLEGLIGVGGLGFDQGGRVVTLGGGARLASGRFPIGELRLYASPWWTIERRIEIVNERSALRGKFLLPGSLPGRWYVIVGNVGVAAPDTLVTVDL